MTSSFYSFAKVVVTVGSFVCRVSSLTSGRGYVLGVTEVAGGFLGVCGDWFGFILTLIFSSF